MPVSLQSHWLPPSSLSSLGLGSISSLRSHYVTLPNPGSSFVSVKDMLEELKQMMAKERENGKCVQS